MNNKVINVESFRQERINFAKAINWTEQVERLANATVAELKHLAKSASANRLNVLVSSIGGVY